jgi:hypothetical protein
LISFYIKFGSHYFSCYLIFFFWISSFNIFLIGNLTSSFFFLPSIRKSRLHDLDHKFKRLVRVKFDLLDPFFLLIFCFSPFNIVFVEDWTLWFCSLSYLWGYYDLLSQVTGLAGRLMLTQFFFFFKWFFEVFLFNVVLVWELRLLVLFNLLSTRFSWSHDQIANMGGWLKWTRVEVFFFF